MQIRIRPITRADGAAIDAFRRMPGVFENTMCLPSARDGTYESYIAAMGSDDHLYVAVSGDDGETVLGTARLSVCGNPRARHCASVSVIVRPEFQGMGVGTALLGELIDLADNWLLLVRLELTVFADNERAIRLYERYGFQKEGIRRMAVARAGKYADEYSMARIRLPELKDMDTSHT